MTENMKSVTPPKKTNRLQDTLRLIRARETGRDEIVRDDGQITHLRLLQNDLQDVIAELPDDMDMFYFDVSDGNPPRLWIDETTFVVMALGNEGYRMLKDTRAGRVLLRESNNRTEIGEVIVHYVAERLDSLEEAKARDRDARAVVDTRRENMQAAGGLPGGHQVADDGNIAARPIPEEVPEEMGDIPVSKHTEGIVEPERAEKDPEKLVVIRPSRLRSFIWFLIGMIVGAVLLFAAAWFREDLAYLGRFLENIQN